MITLLSCSAPQLAHSLPSFSAAFFLLFNGERSVVGESARRCWKRGSSSSPEDGAATSLDDGDIAVMLEELSTFASSDGNCGESPSEALAPSGDVDTFSGQEETLGSGAMPCPVLISMRKMLIGVVQITLPTHPGTRQSSSPVSQLELSRIRQKQSSQP